MKLNPNVYSRFIGKSPRRQLSSRMPELRVHTCFNFSRASPLNLCSLKMATLLDFFKKIPSKKPTKSSPIAADTAEGVKSTSPQEKAKVLTPKSGKENKISEKVNSISHVQNGGLSKCLESDLPKEDLNRKRAMSDEDSDEDEVTGRKVSNAL